MSVSLCAIAVTFFFIVIKMQHLDNYVGIYEYYIRKQNIITEIS